MKLINALFSVAAVGTAGILLSGCGSSNKEAEPPITGSSSEPPVAMKAQWKPEKRYMMHLTVNETSGSRGGNTKQNRRGSMDTEISQDYVVTVTPGLKQQQNLDLEITAFAINVNAGDHTIVFFDSLNKVTPYEGQGVERLTKLIGGKLSYVIGPDNSIVQVKGVNELYKLVENDTSADQGAQRWFGRAGNALLRRYLDNDYFNKLVNINGWPDDATSIGKTWTSQVEKQANMGAQILVSRTHTFRGWQMHNGVKCARIDITGSMSIKPRKNRVPDDTLKLENGKVEGRAWFNPAIGFPSETLLNESYTLVVSPKSNVPRTGSTNTPAPAADKTTLDFAETINMEISDAIDNTKLPEKTILTPPSQDTNSPATNAAVKN